MIFYSIEKQNNSRSKNNLLSKGFNHETNKSLLNLSYNIKILVDQNISQWYKITYLQIFPKSSRNEHFSKAARSTRHDSIKCTTISISNLLEDTLLCETINSMLPQSTKLIPLMAMRISEMEMVILSNFCTRQISRFQLIRNYFGYSH